MFISYCLSGSHRHLPDTDKLVTVSSKQSLSVGGSGQRQTHGRFPSTARSHHVRFQFVHNDLAFQILQYKSSIFNSFLLSQCSLYIFRFIFFSMPKFFFLSPLSVPLDKKGNVQFFTYSWGLQQKEHQPDTLDN